MKGAHQKLTDTCNSLIQEMKLPEAYLQVVENFFLKLSEEIFLLQKSSDKPLLVSINGAQGTGKSTLNRFLKLILEKHFNVSVAAFSLDDFYLTRQQRIDLSKSIHPLLMTRGVPGTHDMQLLESTLDMLLDQWECAIPVFDKSIDDRVSVASWKLQAPVEVILFEGWCNHSPFQTDAELIEPVNALEREEDHQGVWRRYVNEALKNYHDTIFAKTDLTIMLVPPSFEHVFEWRNLQETKLADSAGSDAAHVMDEKAVMRFVQHYERITRHTLKHLPETADIVLPVNARHEIEEIRYRNDW